MRPDDPKFVSPRNLWAGSSRNQLRGTRSERERQREKSEAIRNDGGDDCDVGLMMMMIGDRPHLISVSPSSHRILGTLRFKERWREKEKHSPNRLKVACFFTRKLHDDKASLQ